MSDVAQNSLAENEPDNSANTDNTNTGNNKKTRIVAIGGVLGALAASTCCVVPLVLFSLGISGAWIGQLTALSPYQPIFIAITLGFLGYGYWLVYQNRKAACADDQFCAKPLPSRLVNFSLWFATALIMLAFAWPNIIPFLYG